MVRLIYISVLLFLSSSFYKAQEDSAKVASQNPSPMVELTREHQRITSKEFPGISFLLNTELDEPIDVYITSKNNIEKNTDLLLHFHGKDDIVKFAAEKYEGRLIATNINLGAGSSRYFKSFDDSTKFKSLLDSIVYRSEKILDDKLTIKNIIISGFSAGYGAVKAILSYKNNYQMIDAVLLLDGLHASYIPEGKVLFEGGEIDSTQLDIFVKLATDCAKNKSNKKFLITHSEIFPGTFVSTTESANYILKKLKIKRKPILEWGPLGMQQLGQAEKNNFKVMSFAGNSAPDHIDHLHGLYYFLNELCLNKN